jgi:hypothetical protein
LVECEIGSGAYATSWYFEIGINRAIAIVFLPLLPFILLAIFV